MRTKTLIALLCMPNVSNFVAKFIETSDNLALFEKIIKLRNDSHRDELIRLFKHLKSTQLHGARG